MVCTGSSTELKAAGPKAIPFVQTHGLETNPPETHAKLKHVKAVGEKHNQESALDWHGLVRNSHTFKCSDFGGCFKLWKQPPQTNGHNNVSIEVPIF